MKLWHYHPLTFRTNRYIITTRCFRAGIMISALRIVPANFMAVTDHRRYEPSLEAQAAFAGLPVDRDRLYAMFRRYGWIAVLLILLLVAGAAWMLGGPLASLVDLWHHLGGAAWMPWVVLGVHRAMRRPGPRSTLWLGVCLGLQVLAGSADMVLLTAGLSLVWLAAFSPRPSRRGRDPAIPSRWLRTDVGVRYRLLQPGRCAEPQPGPLDGTVGTDPNGEARPRGVHEGVERTSGCPDRTGASRMTAEAK